MENESKEEKKIEEKIDDFVKNKKEVELQKNKQLDDTTKNKQLDDTTKNKQLDSTTDSNEQLDTTTDNSKLDNDKLDENNNEVDKPSKELTKKEEVESSSSTLARSVETTSGEGNEIINIISNYMNDLIPEKEDLETENKYNRTGCSFYDEFCSVDYVTEQNKTSSFSYSLKFSNYKIDVSSKSGMSVVTLVNIDDNKEIKFTRTDFSILFAEAIAIILYNITLYEDGVISNYNNCLFNMKHKLYKSYLPYRRALLVLVKSHITYLLTDYLDKLKTKDNDLKNLLYKIESQSDHRCVIKISLLLKEKAKL